MTERSTDERTRIPLLVPASTARARVAVSDTAAIDVITAAGGVSSTARSPANIPSAPNA
jgi:ABC-type hemin transport system substrate-binding protein